MDKQYDISRLLGTYFMLAILPTVLFGILGISTTTNTLIWIWDVIMIVSLFSYCIYRRMKLSQKKILIIAIFLFTIAFQYFDYIISLNNNLIKPLYMILPIIYFLHFFSSFILIGNLKIESKGIQRFFNVFLKFVVIAGIYNIALNSYQFVSLLKFTNRYIGFSSFFNHRNAFGQLLFFGIFVNTYLYIKNKNRKYFISFLFILFNLLISFSRASILATLIFLTIFWFERNVSWRKINVIKIIISVLLIFIGIIFVLKNDKMLQFLNFYVFRSEDGLSGRDDLWNIAGSLLIGLRTLIGYGIGTSSQILKSTHLTNTHNTFLELLLSGGIILLIFYLIIYIILFKQIISIKDELLKQVYIAFFMAFIVYGCFEKVLLYSTGYAPIMFTIFLSIIPCISIKNKDGENR